MMNQPTTSAEGANASETWDRKVIPRHQGAIDASEVLPKQGGEPKISGSARMTRDRKVKEIADLRKMLGALPTRHGTPDQSRGGLVIDERIVPVGPAMTR